MFNKLNRCTLALMLLTSSMSFSGPLSTNVVDPNQSYTGDDIRNVVENHMGNNPNIYFVQPIPLNTDKDGINTMAQLFINDVEEIVNLGTPIQNVKLLIPNFYGNEGEDGHWTAAVIRRDKSGNAKLYHNDPTGNPYNPTPLLSKIIELIRGELGDIPIHDLQIRQQSDGTSCGAFTAEDLVVLAEMNGDELTLESARALLSNIKDAQALRNKHAGIVTQENREYFEDENEEYVFNSDKDKKFAEQLRKALPGSEAEKFGDSLDEFEEQQLKEAFSKLIDRPKERNSEIIRAALRHALTDTHNSAMSVIHSRLSNGPLVAAGDDDVAGDTWQHGVWARASISHSKDKANYRC